MEIIQLRNPNALMVPEVQRILKAAVESDALMAPGGLSSVAEDLIEYVTNPNHFLFLGAEAGKFKAMLMGHFPNGQLFPYPQVIVLYNEGSKELKTAIQQRYIDIMLERGYTKTLAMNGSKRSDRAWLKSLTPPNCKAEPLGTVMLMEVL